jgi:hypothetical protein
MPADESSRDARGAGDAAFAAAAAEADEAIRLFCYLRDSEGLDEATARTRAAYIISGIQPLPAPRDNTPADHEETRTPTPAPEAVGERPSEPAYGPTQAPGDEPGEDAQQHSARDAAAFPDALRDTDPWRPAPGQPWQPAARLDPAERRAIEQAGLSAGLPAVEVSAPVLGDLYAENRQFRELDPDRAAARALHIWSQVQATGRDPATALPRASDLTHDGLYQTLRQRGDDHGQALTGTRDENLASLTEPDLATPIPESGSDRTPVGEYGHPPPAPEPPRVPGTDPTYPPQPGGFRPRSDGTGELLRPDEQFELTPLGHAVTTAPAADDADAFDRPAADIAMSTSPDELAAESQASLHRIDATLARARQAIAESDTELTRQSEAPPEQAVEVSPAAHAEPAVQSEEACL